MSEKKLSKEQIEALQKCKTKEEVEKFAKDNQLTDEELEKVAGGHIRNPEPFKKWLQQQDGGCN